MITIHNFARGARGLRAMWQCEEMGLPYRVAFETYPPSEAYLALNPLGSVPFLEDEGGVAIGESVAMCLYLAHRYGPTPLLPSGAASARVLQMCVFSEASLGGAMNPLMEAKFAAPEADKQNWSVRGLDRRARQFIDYLETALGDRPYLAGDELTLADICIVTALGVWKGALDGAIPERLAAYRERLSERPAYQRAATVAAG